MTCRPFFLFVWSLMGSLTLMAQQSDSPMTIRKDYLYEKSGGRGIQVVNVQSINTEHLDFSPAWYHDGLVFISSRKRGGFVDNKIGERFFQMYYSRLDPHGLPVQPEPFSMDLNSPLHEGPVSFSRSGDRIYFTTSNQKKGVQRTDASGRVRMRVLTAERGPQGWINIRSLPINADTFSTMHPSLSPDGRTLYFSSDRHGGMGGYDIWSVERMGDTWGQPVNLGPDVNSEGNEVFPFIHFSGFLFYSSDGLEDGPGGLDIYALNTRHLPGTSPQILPAPFNSSHDDLGFILDESGHKGFFSSDRPGGTGKDDIYAFESHYSLAGELEEFAVRVGLQVADAQTGQPVTDARIYLIRRDAFGGIPGEALYEMEVTREDQRREGPLTLNLVRKKRIDLDKPDVQSDETGMALAELRQDQAYLLIVDKPGYTMKEIDYRSPAAPGAYELEIVLTPLQCYPIEGVVKNQKTGEPLAGATVLIEAGGQSRPIQMESDPQGRFSYCLPESAAYALSASKGGYVPGRSRVNTADAPSSEVRRVELLLLPFGNTAPEKSPERLTEGSVIVLENLYYDYNKSTLRPGSANELDLVFDLMRRYPEMEIELGSHTDCRGSESFNQRLSESRAASARNYLISRGIQPSRIVARGFGESRLRNHCQDGVTCSEEEHEENRRTEIRITRLDSPVEVRYGKPGR